MTLKKLIFFAFFNSLYFQEYPVKKRKSCKYHFILQKSIVKSLRVFLEMRFFKFADIVTWRAIIRNLLEICTEYYWIYLLYNDLGYFWLDENQRFGTEKATIL